VRIAIDGSGVAALALAVLLARRGVEVVLSEETASTDAADARTVMLPSSTVALLALAWEVQCEQLAGAVALVRRRIAWQSEQFEVVPSPSIGCSVATLRAALRGRAKSAGVRWTEWPRADATWYVVTRRNAAASRLAFGARVATEGSLPMVTLARDESLVRVVPDGWFFAAPALAPRRGTAVTLFSPTLRGTGLEALAEASERLWPGVTSELQVHHVSPAMPTLALDQMDAGSLPVGEAASTLDPLRGDGVGNALRSALLACAVLSAGTNGPPRADHLEHYRHRIRNSQRVHVGQCVHHYQAAWNALLWIHELEAMLAGLTRLGAPEPLTFTLRDGQLEPAR
jgi:flavin-dependent dehydrogenase